MTYVVTIRVCIDKVCSTKAALVGKMLFDISVICLGGVASSISAVGTQFTIVSPLSIGEYRTPRAVHEKELPPSPGV